MVCLPLYAAAAYERRSPGIHEDGASMIVDKINAFLSSDGQAVDDVIVNEVGLLSRIAFLRQFLKRDDQPGTLRLSSIGKCMRQQAYSALGFPVNGKQIDSRARMVFFMGDLTEIAIIQLAKAAGCVIARVGQDQMVVEIDGIQGHPDGIFKNGKDYLLEAKSMSSYSFKEFQRGVIDDGYRFQVNAYMHALGLTEAIIVALNKDAGVLAEMVILKDLSITEDILSRIKLLKVATKESLPERGHSANEKGFYPWNCLYCSFHGTCLPNAEKVLVKDAYKLKEKTA